MESARNRILSKIRNAQSKVNLWNELAEPTNQVIYAFESNDLLVLLKNATEPITIDLHVLLSNSELEQSIFELFSNQNVACFDPELQLLLSQQKISFKTEIELSTPYLMGFIACEFLTARTASVLTSSALASGRRLNIFPDHQVVLVRQNQLVLDIEDAIEGVKAKYDTLPSMISFATGPSRTADIEKTLILGAHGPKKLSILFCNFT
jgi:L-lactate dehydrogenase complex protein LldG